jgi:hypothetical protein
MGPGCEQGRQIDRDGKQSFSISGRTCVLSLVVEAVQKHGIWKSEAEQTIRLCLTIKEEVG